MVEKPSSRSRRTSGEASGRAPSPALKKTLVIGEDQQAPVLGVEVGGPVGGAALLGANLVAVFKGAKFDQA